MARFDVYANPDKSESKLIPFYLDVQSDHIKGLQTRIVVPLWESGLLPEMVEDLNPVFAIAGRQVVMDTPALGAAPTSALLKTVGSLAAEQMTIQDALDTLFGSY
ncbi:MAG: CcdB family protein [Polaromonas sp.]